jgi:hypothetical protein
MGLFSGGNSTSTSTTNNVSPALSSGGGDLNGDVSAGMGNTLYGKGAQTSVAQVEGSSNVVNMLDQGAVSNSLALALKGVELVSANAKQAQQSAAQSQAGAQAMLQGVFDSQGAVTKQLASAVETVKTADLKTIGLGVLAMVAVVVGVVYANKG